MRRRLLEEQKAEHDARRKTKRGGGCGPAGPEGRCICISGYRAHDLSSLRRSPPRGRDSCVRPPGSLWLCCAARTRGAVPWHAARRPKAKERSRRSNWRARPGSPFRPGLPHSTRLATGKALPRRFRYGGRRRRPFAGAASDKSSLHDSTNGDQCCYSGELVVNTCVSCGEIMQLCKSTASRHECQTASAMCPRIEGE